MVPLACVMNNCTLLLLQSNRVKGRVRPVAHSTFLFCWACTVGLSAFIGVYLLMPALHVLYLIFDFGV